MICRACLRAGARPLPSLLPSSSTRPLRQTANSLHSLPSVAPPSYSSYSRRRSVISVAPVQLSGTPFASAHHLPLSSSRRHFFTPAPASSAAADPTSVAAPEKPDFLSEGESQVWDILVAEFAPTELVVQDISGGCGSMYGIEIGSHKFRGLNMLKQQRLVNAALGDLVKEWHGMQLKTKIP